MEINHQVMSIHFDEENSKAVADMLTDLISSKSPESYDGFEELSIKNDGLEYFIKFQFVHEWNREAKPQEEIIHQDIIIRHIQIFDEEGNPIGYTSKKDIEGIIKDYLTY